MKRLLLPFAILAASATVLLGLDQSRSPWQWAAFIVVAMAVLIQVYAALAGVVGPTTSKRERDATRVVRNRLASLYEQGHLRDQFTHISIHVWMVPASYRALVPFRLRKWARSQMSDDFCERRSLRPRLVLVTYFGLRDHHSSGVGFRKGYGLVGSCLAENGDKPLAVDFRRPDLRSALAGSNEDWRALSPRITHGLRQDHAKRIADRYEQAIARVISDNTSNEALGVVTLEARSGFQGCIVDNEALGQQLNGVAGILAPILAIRRYQN